MRSAPPAWMRRSLQRILAVFVLGFAMPCGLAAAAPARGKVATAQRARKASHLEVLRHEGSCHGYLAIDHKSKTAVLVDAPTGSAKRFLGEVTRLDLEVQAILLTHAHGDHTAELAELQRATGAPVLHLSTPWALSRRAMATNEGQRIAVQDGQIVHVGAMRFHVMELPGHTEDSIGFYDPVGGSLFAGDTLQAGAMGGSVSDPVFLHSLHRLTLLPPATKLYAGHGIPTTIGNEAPWIRSMLESEAPELLPAASR